MNSKYPLEQPRGTPRFCAALSLAAAVLALCGGCAHYHPEPLSPVAIQQQLQHYSLADLASEYSRAGRAVTPPDISEGLGPDEAGLAALVLNPALKARRLERGIAAGQLITAGLYPNPTFDNKSLLGSQRPPGHKSIEGGFSIEVLRWQEQFANAQAKKANVEAVHHEILADEWKAVIEARAAYWSVVAARERLKLNQKELDLSERLLNSVKTRIKRGIASAFDSNVSELQLLKLRTERLKFESDAAAAERLLKQAIGLPFDAEIKLRIATEPYAQSPRAWNARELCESLPSSALLKANEWRYEVSEGELRAAVARQYPSLKLGPSGTFDFDGHIWSALYGFVGTVDIPLIHRNQGEIREKYCARELARADYTAKLQAAQAAVANAAALLESSAKRLQFLEKELYPKALETISLTEKAYTLGEIPGNDLLIAKSLFVETEKSRLDLSIEYRLNLEALEAALGRRLDDVPASAPAGGK